LHKQVKYPDRSFFSLGDPQVVNISTNLIYLLPKTWPIFVSRTHIASYSRYLDYLATFIAFSSR
jgi:hypothetical protein